MSEGRNAPQSITQSTSLDAIYALPILFFHAAIGSYGRIYDLERKKMHQARSELRTAAQGTGDRADKIRTYNFPQVIHMLDNIHGSACKRLS